MLVALLGLALVGGWNNLEVKSISVSLVGLSLLTLVLYICRHKAASSS
jgi:hypothetical protein